jgi:hypothetical protein
MTALTTATPAAWVRAICATLSLVTPPMPTTGISTARATASRRYEERGAGGAHEGQQGSALCDELAGSSLLVTKLNHGCSGRERRSSHLDNPARRRQGAIGDHDQCEIGRSAQLLAGAGLRAAPAGCVLC